MSPDFQLAKRSRTWKPLAQPLCTGNNLGFMTGKAFPVLTQQTPSGAGHLPLEKPGEALRGKEAKAHHLGVLPPGITLLQDTCESERMLDVGTESGLEWGNSP